MSVAPSCRCKEGKLLRTTADAAALAEGRDAKALLVELAA
jgi:hypothetical protein